MPQAVAPRPVLTALLATLLVTGIASAAADLEVVYIERTPKYPGYQDRVAYVGNRLFEDDFHPYEVDVATSLREVRQVEDGDGSATDLSVPLVEAPGKREKGGPPPGPPPRRWPDDGETVTFTAHVLNRGPGDAGAFEYVWRLDGKVVERSTCDLVLGPGETTELSREWTWEFAPHRVALEVTLPGDPRRSNNSVEDYTHALQLFSYIDRSYAKRFQADTARVKNPTTDSITEWLQRHRARMNEMFEKAGSPLRWRFDLLGFLDEGEPTPAIDRPLYDGAFPTRFTLADKDWRLGASGYYDASEDIDYGYLHEVAHQLGIIDLYRMNVPPEQNKVNHSAYTGTQCLMTGCSHFISRHTALAMKSWHGKRRGYFGQYLFDLPRTIRLRFLDATGQPLEGAEVAVYQKIETPGTGEHIPDRVKFSGVTGPGGLYTLPNVEVDSSLFWTDTGNVLRPNPFGYISNHGENGVFLIRVEKNEMVHWAWFDITEPNLAFWQGQTDEATFERKTGIGRGVTRVVPPDLCEENAASWHRWAQDGAITLADDRQVKQEGRSSLRLDITGGFDNLVRFPGDTLARWDLSGLREFRFSALAKNKNPFQNASPWVRLGNHKKGYFEWHPTSDLLNEARDRWVTWRVSVAGDAVWKRSTVGDPDLADINYFELHADTWDYGFTLWLDGVRLGE